MALRHLDLPFLGLLNAIKYMAAASGGWMEMQSNMAQCTYTDSSFNLAPGGEPRFPHT